MSREAAAKRSRSNRSRVDTSLPRLRITTRPSRKTAMIQAALLRKSIIREESHPDCKAPEGTAQVKVVVSYQVQDGRENLKGRVPRRASRARPSSLVRRLLSRRPRFKRSDDSLLC